MEKLKDSMDTGMMISTDVISTELVEHFITNNCNFDKHLKIF